MLNILTVVGARPQFIKAAAFSRALTRVGDTVSERTIHTGQHYDPAMSDIFFTELDIPAPYRNLGIAGGQHGAATGRMLEAIEQEILDAAPHIVLVYGDTNSTLAGALAAAKLHVPVAHVEAGMRSFRRSMPEEINRVLTDHLATLLFCTSESSANHLAREGIGTGIHVVGDIMYDAVLYHRAQAKTDRPLPGAYALLTLHRAENVDDRTRLACIVDALAALDCSVYFPIHPRTAARLDSFAIKLPKNVAVVTPLSYLELLGATMHAEFVLTDSGGLQKEAYYLTKKCICLRNETEWNELVEIGANRLTDVDPEAMLEAAAWARVPATFHEQPYGDGSAAQRIVRVLHDWALAEGIIN